MFGDPSPFTKLAGSVRSAFKAKRSLVRERSVGVRSRGFDPPDSQRRDVSSRVRRQVRHKSHRPINSVTTLVVRLPDEPSERICPLPGHHHPGAVHVECTTAG